MKPYKANGTACLWSCAEKTWDKTKHFYLYLKLGLLFRCTKKMTSMIEDKGKTRCRGQTLSVTPRDTWHWRVGIVWWSCDASSFVTVTRHAGRLYYVHVELSPEKQLKIKSGFFLNGVNISASQMIIGNSKGVNNRHVWFGSIASSGKVCNGHFTYMASP